MYCTAVANLCLLWLSVTCSVGTFGVVNPRGVYVCTCALTCVEYWLFHFFPSQCQVKFHSSGLSVKPSFFTCFYCTLLWDFLLHCSILFPFSLFHSLTSFCLTLLRSAFLVHFLFSCLPFSPLSQSLSSFSVRPPSLHRSPSLPFVPTSPLMFNMLSAITETGIGTERC